MVFDHNHWTFFGALGQTLGAMICEVQRYPSRPAPSREVFLDEPAGI